MQSVSSTLLTALQSSNSTAKALSIVVEIYDQDAVPGSSGFDPSSSDCLLRLAQTKGISFMGESYTQLITAGGIGNVKRTLRKELSRFSFTISNSSRSVIDFENSYGFEGKLCVVRMIDRNVSTVLADTCVLFTGRCEKIQNFSKSSESATIQVKQILNQTETMIPRRKFTVDDLEGRSPSDSAFEGFRFSQRNGSVTYIEKVKKKFLFFFSYTKKVKTTVQYSSHSDADQEKIVPLVLGRVQTELTNFAYEDKGTSVDVLAIACDGYENGIAEYENIRSVTDGFPITVLGERYGLLGGTGTQTIRDSAFVGAGLYSKTAYVEANATGSLAENDDPAPQIVAIILGLKVPNYGSDGVWDETSFSDNPVVLSRWALTSENVFNLNSSWMDDTWNTLSALYCNQVLFDQTNSETVALKNTQVGVAGVDYYSYQSTAYISPKYWKYVSGLDSTYDAYKQESDYQYYATTPYNSDDPTGSGTSALPSKTYRRRYTANVMLSEQMSAIDFLYDIVLPTCNGYLVQTSTGKIAIKIAKPIDHTFVYTATSVSATTIKVQSILPWVGVTNQRILIGANLTTSEVRRVSSVAYDTGTAKTITATGNCSSSSATLTGGSSSVAPNATVTVSSATSAKVVTIDGYVLTYTPTASDTTVTCAAFIAAMVNSHHILNKYIGATWVAGESTVLIYQKIGTLTLDSALAYAHNTKIADASTAPSLSATGSGSSLAAGTYKVGYSYETLEGETLVSSLASITITAGQKIRVAAITPLPTRVVNARWYVSPEAASVRLRYAYTNTGGTWDISSLPNLYAEVEPVANLTGEEIHNVAMAFADKASTQAALTSSNMIKGSFQFPMGNRQPSTNEIKLKYRDASQDFKASELRVRDTANIAKIKKVNTKEINGAAIDSYHQARRLANQKLAEWRDGDFFHGFSSDGEALLLEEGDVICVTDESGRFVNEPIRVEDVEITNDDGYPSISIIGRKYRRYYYDDQIQEKLVPLPIVVNSPLNVEQGAPTIAIASAATNTAVSLSVTDNTQTALFRKIEFSSSSDMSSATTTVVSAASNGGVLPNPQPFTKASETSAVTRYFRVSHSSTGVAYGNVSNILSVTFASSGGSGGSGGSGSAPIIAASDYNTGDMSTDISISVAAGGSGNYQLQKSFDGSAWTTITSTWSGASAYNYTGAAQRSYDYDVYFRAKRADDSSTYSSSVLITVPAS